MKKALEWELPERLRTLHPSQIRENMRIAKEVGAINLAQGRPDFPADHALKEAAVEAIRADHNQYSVTWGEPALREAVARSMADLYGMSVDVDREVTITCGVTEAMVAAILATMERGDEVLVIEPAHENYVPAIRFAGAVPRFFPLRAPNFDLDPDELAQAIGPKVRGLILNTPHNPTGRVLTRDVLEAVAATCVDRNLIVFTDEIYDRLCFDKPHVPLSTLEGMGARTILCGGISKVHCVTGWRLGYAIAPPRLSDALRVVHDYTTICAPTPLQHAALVALAQPGSFYESLRERLRSRRDQMMSIFAKAGFSARAPEGAYYVMASFDEWAKRFSVADAESLARHLIVEAGVATVPGSAFYLGNPELGRRLLRFAFAKTEATLEQAGEQLQSAFEKPGSLSSRSS